MAKKSTKAKLSAELNNYLNNVHSLDESQKLLEYNNEINTEFIKSPEYFAFAKKKEEIDKTIDNMFDRTIDIIVESCKRTYMELNDKKIEKLFVKQLEQKLNDVLDDQEEDDE